MLLVAVVIVLCAIVADGWDHGDKHPRFFTYASVPYETFEIGHSGTFASLSGDEKHRFEADLVSVTVADDHAAYFRMRMRQYRFSITQELHPEPIPEDWWALQYKRSGGAPPERPKPAPTDWFYAWVRVPAGSSPDAAALIAGIPGIREAQPSPVLTTDVVGATADDAVRVSRR